jgi:LPXTG-site transpeptidase (sortase) family protein
MVQPAAKAATSKPRSAVDFVLWTVIFACALILLWPALGRGQSWISAYLSQRHLRRAWATQSTAPLSLGPDRERWPFTRLIIPRMNLDAIVVDGVDDYSLTAGPGHDPLSSGPGRGNCVIAGHRNLGQWWFYHLGSLRPRDSITLQTMGKTYRYRVQSVRTVPDSALHLLQVRSKKPVLTLYTCTVPKTSRRVLVSAVLTGD